MLIVLGVMGCQDRGPDPRAGQSPATAQVALGGSSASIGSGGAAPATVAPTPDRADSIVARARAELRSARPTFHEWEDSSAVGISLKEAGPAPFASRPVVGDFDEDGTPDVICIGRDARGESIVAVLSHRGHTVVVDVTGDGDAPASGPVHRRLMRLATVFTDHDQVGLEVIEREASGEFPLPPSQFVYFDGHFMQWIEGN